MFFFSSPWLQLWILFEGFLKMLPVLIVAFAAGCCFCVAAAGVAALLGCPFQFKMRAWCSSMRERIALHEWRHLKTVIKPFLIANSNGKGHTLLLLFAPFSTILATLKSLNSPFWCHEDIVKRYQSYFLRLFYSLPNKETVRILAEQYFW